MQFSEPTHECRNRDVKLIFKAIEIVPLIHINICTCFPYKILGHQKIGSKTFSLPLFPDAFRTRSCTAEHCSVLFSFKQRKSKQVSMINVEHVVPNLVCQ